MFTLFDQPFKINRKFESKADFETLLLSEFKIDQKQSSFLYDGFFEYNKVFTYYDIDAYFNSTSEYHDFLANGLIVEAG